MKLEHYQGFQAAASQQMKSVQDFNSEPDLTSLRRAALIIHDQYLSDKVKHFGF